MTETTPFPQRSLLLGVTWFPATFLALWACQKLNWWSAHHVEPSLAISFTAIFLFVLLMQARTVFRAITVLLADAATRLPLNYLLLAVGVLTAVLAAGFTVVFGLIAFNP